MEVIKVCIMSSFQQILCVEEDAVLIAAPVNADVTVCSQARVRKCRLIVLRK